MATKIETIEGLLALHPKARKVVEVDLPGGETAFVRALTSAERDAFETDGIGAADRMINFRARYVAACLCTQAGLSINCNGHAANLGDLPAYVIEPLFEAARILNGLSDGQVDAAGKN